MSLFILIYKNALNLFNWNFAVNVTLKWLNFLIVIPQNSKKKKITLLRSRYETPILKQRIMRNRIVWEENFDV
jgi:hypothetical protein